jgi:predicted nucleotidyltransferase component of viral defense system
MSLLTTFQEKLVKEIADSPLQQEFHLTGGTALAEFYLQHRYSLDLAFSTADPNAVARVGAFMDEIADRLNAKVTYTRSLGSFLQCFLESSEGERVQIDFAQDSPYRLQPLEANAELGVLVESLIDIACNKLSALFDRAEPKDFVDVYFICRGVMPFDELVKNAREKHPGMDDYWLAVALQRVEHIELLPRMIKPLDLDEMKRFFLEQAAKLVEKIDPGG